MKIPALNNEQTLSFIAIEVGSWVEPSFAPELGSEERYFTICYSQVLDFDQNFWHIPDGPGVWSGPWSCCVASSKRGTGSDPFHSQLCPQTSKIEDGALAEPSRVATGNDPECGLCFSR